MVEDRNYIDYNYEDDFYDIPDSKTHMDVPPEMVAIAGLWIGH